MCKLIYSIGTLQQTIYVHVHARVEGMLGYTSVLDGVRVPMCKKVF